MKTILKYKNHVMLHAVILIWGFTGILGKLIQIPSVNIVWYRMLIACVALFVYLKLSKFSLKVSVNSLLKLFGVGIIVALHWIFFFEALKVSTVSVTLTTLASATLFTGVLEPFFFKRKLVLYELVFGILVIVGLALIFSFESKYTLGIIYALLSAFFASLFTTLNGKLVLSGLKARAITFYEMLGGTLAISLYLMFSGVTLDTSFLPGFGRLPELYSDLFYLILLGVLCTAVAFVVSVEVMRELTPFTVSVSINLEPIYSIILALVFFGDAEKMTPGFYVGALLILFTIFGNGWMKKRAKVKA